MFEKVKYIKDRIGLERYRSNDAHDFRLIIEQSPRKRTILTYDKTTHSHKSYYLAFPYMVLMPTITFTKYEPNHLRMHLEAGMSREPLVEKQEFAGKQELDYVPLPNICKAYVCLNNRSKKLRENSVEELIKSIDTRVNEMLADFWASSFISCGGYTYPDYRNQLANWEELSKIDDMAAFSFGQFYTHGLSWGYSLKLRNVLSPENLPNRLAAIMNENRNDKHPLDRCGRKPIPAEHINIRFT